MTTILTPEQIANLNNQKDKGSPSIGNEHERGIKDAVNNVNVLPTRQNSGAIIGGGNTTNQTEERTGINERRQPPTIAGRGRAANRTQAPNGGGNSGRAGFRPNAALLRKDAAGDGPLVKKLGAEDLEVMNMDVTSRSNDLATDEELALLSVLLEKAGVNEGVQQAVLIDIAWVCKDVGTSAQSVLPGKSMHCELKRYEIAGIIKEATTLRRICAFYAKVIWTLMLELNEPPTNWQAKGFKKETRFAAFDFFHGVCNAGAYTPTGSALREPSQEEILANEMSKEVKIRRKIISQGIKGSNLSEVNGCDMGLVRENHFKK